MAKRTAPAVLAGGPDLADLTPDPANARTHGDVNRARIRQSLADVGAGRSILINAAGKILAGHGIVQEAKALGLKLKIVPGDADTLIAVQRTDLTPDQETRAALWDNRAGDDGTYDVGMIAKLAAAGLTAGIFSDQDVRTLKLAARKGGQRKHPDDVPPLRDSANVALGDSFSLGRHRLLCGDATKREDVEALMSGDRADVMITDPPYGVLFGGSGGGKANAIRGDLSQAEIPVSFAVALEHALGPDARIYLCGGSTNLMTYWKLFDHYLRIMPRLIVWVKESFLLRHNNYHSQFELIFFGWKGKGGDPSNWHGDRKQSDCWQITRDPVYVHPTQKPVALFAKAIQNSCPPDGIVFEPFAGSGTALIAAEAEGRTCYALELDPRFAQVIVERWEQFTGHTAGRRATGTPWPKGGS
jgi:DNA modification methylase